MAIPETGLSGPSIPPKEGLIGKIKKWLGRDVSAGGGSSTPAVTHAAQAVFSSPLVSAGTHHPIFAATSRGSRPEGSIGAFLPVLEGTSRDQPLFFTSRGKPAKMWKNHHNGISIQVGNMPVISISKDGTKVFYKDDSQGLDISDAKARQWAGIFHSVLGSIRQRVPVRAFQMALPGNWNGILRTILATSPTSSPQTFSFQGKSATMWGNKHGGISIQIPGEPLISVSSDQRTIFVGSHESPLNSPQSSFFRGMFIQALNTALNPGRTGEGGGAIGSAPHAGDEALFLPPASRVTWTHAGNSLEPSAHLGPEPISSVPSNLAADLYSFMRRLPKILPFSDNSGFVYPNPNLGKITVYLEKNHKGIYLLSDGKAYNEDGSPYQFEDRESFLTCVNLLQRALANYKHGAAPFPPPEEGGDETSSPPPKEGGYDTLSESEDKGAGLV